MNFSKNKKGFTLVELMISVGILVMVFIMASVATSFAVGKTGSGKAKNLTKGIRNPLEFMSQKFQLANATATAGTNPIYGFAVLDGSNNPIATGPGNPIPQGVSNKANAHTLGSDEKIVAVYRDASGDVSCAAFRYDSSDPKQGKIFTNIPTPPTCNAGTGEIDKKITPDTINITSFKVAGEYRTGGSIQPAPYLTIFITAQDKTDSSNTIDYQSTFTMDYAAVNQLH